jgi:glycerate dehydrogenase
MAHDNPRIVVLDGWTTNPGDLDWAPLEAIGPTTVHDRTPPGELLSRLADAQVAFTNKTALRRETLTESPDLRFIGVLATGFDIVDVVAAKEQGVVVANVPAYSTQSVAQMAMAHVLNFAQHVADHAEAVKQGGWARCPDFCFWEHPLVELDGKTMGIVGFGRIGRATARLATAFGMNILAYKPSPIEASELPDYVRMVDVDTVFRESDFVSLHCPLTPESQQLVSGERLRLMKPTAFLINTSRGPLVDEGALADALRNGHLAGAGLDVLTVEPPPADHPLYSVDNCHITPHIAWATSAARSRLLQMSVDNLQAFLAGTPKNVVNR